MTISDKVAWGLGQIVAMKSIPLGKPHKTINDFWTVELQLLVFSMVNVDKQTN